MVIQIGKSLLQANKILYAILIEKKFFYLRSKTFQLEILYNLPSHQILIAGYTVIHYKKPHSVYRWNFNNFQEPRKIMKQLWKQCPQLKINADLDNNNFKSRP